MDLNAVKLFVLAADAGSISEAARRNGIPLPTFSRQLRKLENEIGKRLMERGPRGLMLTPAGNQLISDAQPALASLAQAEQRLYDVSGVAGKLRLSMPPHLESLWPLFRDFGHWYPSVTFDVFVTDRRVDLVADGIDIAIRVGDQGNAGYVGRTLASYRHRLVCSPRFFKEHSVKTPHDLTRVPCACWRSPGGNVWHLGDSEIAVEPVFVTNDYLHLLSLAEAGEVVTEVPPFLATPGLNKRILVETLPDHPMPEISMRALVVERRAMSPLVRQFLDYASENVAQALDLAVR